MNQVELLNRITSRIRQSLELQAILDAAVTEVRAFLKTDRVKIYKFDEDGNGQVIAEAIDGDRLPSLKGLHFPAGDIPPQTRELFIKAKIRSIVNLDQGKMSLSQPDSINSTPPGELTVEEVRQESLNNLLQRPVDPCHVEYLTLMGVKATMVVPLLVDNKLWGLLIAHHRRAKVFSNRSLRIVQNVAEQLEMAIAQANLYQTVRQKAEGEALINEISRLLHSPLENEKILPAILAKIVPAIAATGGLLCMNDSHEGEVSCYQYGSLPSLTPSDWMQLQSLVLPQQQITVIDDLLDRNSIKALIPPLRQNKLRSLLLMPLRYKQEILGNLAVFRPARDVTKLWAGDRHQDTRQARPRQSFEEWKELIRGQTQPWTSRDLELLQALGNNLAIAVMQDQLFRQERKQRLLVEMHNRQLEKASRLKSEFLSTSSHELRTPLALILNYLKLLKEGFYDNEQELFEYIETAHLSAENLHTIVDDLLDITKIEAGKMEVELENFPLEPLLQEQYSFFKPDSIRQDIELILDCQVDTVYGDRSKLRQILTNLLNNAFKFTQQGEINLQALAKTKSLVEISVSDTGIGIEPEKQIDIFDAFTQEDGSIRRRYGGTGLGLTICKQLVELMSGEIYLESAGRNCGTKVTITLPKSDAYG